MGWRKGLGLAKITRRWYLHNSWVSSVILSAENASFVSFAVAPVLNPVHGVFANTVYFASKDVTGHLTVTVGQCALVEEVRFWQLDGGGNSVT